MSQIGSNYVELLFDMGTAPKIESSNLSIVDLFKDFYSVPDFQREYVWKRENVEKLLNDIFEELYNSDQPVKDTEYFLGSIVVCKDKENNFQLIDGQQRMTTIYLIFCVLRNLIQNLNEDSKSLDQLIAGVQFNSKTGDDITKYRLALQYDTDSETLLQEIASGKSNLFINKKINNNKTLSSVDNLKIAIKVINIWLNDQFPSEARSLKIFTNTFVKQIKLIRIETPNLKNALRVFETINNTGVGLTPADLLKNYLFIHISKDTHNDQHIQKLKYRWTEFINILYKCNQKPETFLRYYLMSHYSVNLSNIFPEEEVYDWFVDEKNKHYINHNTLAFIEKLVLASKHYANFVDNKNIDGTNNEYLENIRRLQGGYKQHHVLLLAGRFLPIELFTLLCKHIENLLFIYAITSSSGRKDINLMRTFAIWSRELRQIKEEKELNEFINKYFYGEVINTLPNYFDQIFSKFNEGMVGKPRLRYILAKIAQYTEEKAYGNKKSLNWYLDKKHHVEHILSQSNRNSDFDLPEQYNTYCKKLGNLTLLEEAINTSISDKNYESKKSDYEKSQFLITKSIASSQKIGDNTSFNRAIDELSLCEFNNWNSRSIDIRQEIMAKLARKVWGLE